MEIVTGHIKLRDIFLHNGNWWKLFLKHPELIRLSVIINVLKLLVCKTSFLGYHLFICPNCNKTLKVPHTCKSRLCPSCGKRATDDWIKTALNSLPQTIWQHISFTLPDVLWDFFWVNRYLMNLLPKIAADIIKDLFKQEGFLPGIFLAIHTFGRDLKRNYHIHLSSTVGGLSLDYTSWSNNAYIYHEKPKAIWKYKIITLLRNEFKKGRLKVPKHLSHLKSYETFSSWLNLSYNKTWDVHLKPQSDNMKTNVEYLGKYLKRPPIGETRIKNYDGLTVTYEFLDHATQTMEIMSLPVLDFISRLIQHIPDKNFRLIRYYGFLSNRLRPKLLPTVFKLLNLKKTFTTKVYTPWKQMIINTFKYNPLLCPTCKKVMNLKYIVPQLYYNLIPFHKDIAHGYFKPLRA